MTPLLAARGAAATSRDLADVAGVAEGTLFRAFGSKGNLIHAVLENYLDAEVLRTRFSGTDDDASLDVVVSSIMRILSDRVTGLFVIASAIDPGGTGDHRKRGRPHPSNKHGEDLARMDQLIADQLEPYAAQLSISPAKAAEFIRGVAFTAAFPRARSVVGITQLSVEELTALALHGVAADTP